MAVSVSLGTGLLGPGGSVVVGVVVGGGVGVGWGVVVVGGRGELGCRGQSVSCRRHRCLLRRLWVRYRYLFGFLFRFLFRVPFLWCLLC